LEVMKLAVIKTGGKQYLVQEGTVLDIEKLPGEAGAEIKFTEVLMVANDDSVTLGTPLVADMVVTGQVVEQFREDKILVSKIKRRKRYRRKAGHRQEKTRVKIVGMVKS